MTTVCTKKRWNRNSILNAAANPSCHRNETLQPSIILFFKVCFIRYKSQKIYKNIWYDTYAMTFLLSIIRNSYKSTED